MKKNLILILLFLVHFNIFSQNQTEFENSFGIKNVKILNELIRDFEEDILSKNYSTLSTDKAYESYLNDYVGSQLSNKEFNTTVSIKKFNRSRIKSLIYCNIDTVYVGPSERAPEINIRAIITKYNFHLFLGRKIFTSSISNRTLVILFVLILIITFITLR